MGLFGFFWVFLDVGFGFVILRVFSVSDLVLLDFGGFDGLEVKVVLFGL